MAIMTIKDVNLKIGTETQFQERLKSLPIGTLVGTTDPIQEGELDTSIITKLDKAENALPKPTNDTTGSAGQVLKKTENGSEWGTVDLGGAITSVDLYASVNKGQAGNVAGSDPYLILKKNNEYSNIQFVGNLGATVTAGPDGKIFIASAQVIANPSTASTATLTKLNVNGTIYSIPSGGAGGVTSVTTSGDGNAVTGASISGSTLTLTKGSTFLTSHQSLANCAKLTDQNTFNVRQITLGYWQAGKDNGDHIVYGSSEIKYTYKSGIISNEYTTYTFSFPKKGNGTFALTSDIPNISTCAKLSGGNTFSGVQKFNDKVNIISNDGLYVSGPTQVNTLSITMGKILYPASEANIYEYKLPDMSGTLAIKDDIVEFSGTNKYLGTAYCQLTREATMWLNGQYGSYTCPGYLVAGYGSGSTMSNADIVAIGPGGLYKYPSTSGKIKFTLPSTAGTLALTEDIKIKSATLSGTTLTLTI